MVFKKFLGSSKFQNGRSHLILRDIRAPLVALQKIDEIFLGELDYSRVFIRGLAVETPCSYVITLMRRTLKKSCS